MTPPDRHSSPPQHDSNAPTVGIRWLDQLWFQVAGTRCNLSCHHCFISCHPKNRTFGFLTLGQICQRLDESIPLGVKEYYFTGGEPFLNPDMTEILERTLTYGPATVLTNGTVLKEDWLTRLQHAQRHSTYSLEFRVSIDGFSSATNDPIRGQGTFHRAMKGVAQLVRHGFMPIITAVRTWDLQREGRVIDEFVSMLKDIGYARPRLKVLPTLQIGEEKNRSGGYSAAERVTQAMMDGYDPSQLVCNNSRIVTDRGVHVCPILIESPDSLLGQKLDESLRPFALHHGACFTCYQYGSICANATGQSMAPKQIERQLPTSTVPLNPS